jgi:hypothetical protein
MGFLQDLMAFSANMNERAVQGLIKPLTDFPQSNLGMEDFMSREFDRGADINPFAKLAQTLGGSLSRRAGLFGDQQQQALLSGGRFDPALAASARQRAFGQSQTALTEGLANLSGLQGQFQERQRRFNVGEESRRFLGGGQLSLEELAINEEIRAAQPTTLSVLEGIGNAVSGFLPW